MAYKFNPFTNNLDDVGSSSGDQPIISITGNTGGAETPDSGGNFNLVGSGSIVVDGTANTETVHLNGLTNHAVLVGAGTDTITKVGPTATTGAVLQNNSGADPSYSTAAYPSTAGTSGNVLKSNGTNWVSSSPTFTGMVWTDRGSSVSVLSNSGSFATASIILTLPATPTQGDTCEFCVSGAFSLVLDAPSTHLIQLGNVVTSAGGTCTSSGLSGDSIKLVYRSSNTTWYAVGGPEGIWSLA